MVTVNVAEVDPPGTVTVAGTVIPPLFEESETTMPPAGATLVSDTVPVLDVPPVTSKGESVTFATSGALTVNAAV